MLYKSHTTTTSFSEKLFHARLLADFSRVHTPSDELLLPSVRPAAHPEEPTLLPALADEPQELSTRIALCDANPCYLSTTRRGIAESARPGRRIARNP
jgi:hypothetical protein